MSPELTALLKSAREQETFRELNLMKVPACLSTSAYLPAYLPVCLSVPLAQSLSLNHSFLLPVSDIGDGGESPPGGGVV